MNKLIQVKDDLTFGNKDYNIYMTLKKGIEYLVNPDMLHSLQSLYKNKLEFIEDIKFQSVTPLEQCKKILIYRAGGIGDILFILPYLPKIKKMNPNIKITFCSMSQNVPILHLSDYIDEIIIDPIEYEKAKTFDKVFNFIHFIEENPLAETINAYDIAESEKFFNIKKDDLVSNKMLKKLPILEYPHLIHIMIQFSCSTVIREISPTVWWELATTLDPQKYRITLIGSKINVKNINETIEMIKKYSKIKVESFTSTTLTEAIEQILEKDIPHIFVGPDSGLTNLAGYHGIPTIGLYGPFPSKLRMQYYRYAIGVDSITNCIFRKNKEGNCFQHGMNPCQLSQIKNTNFSPCLELLTSNHIIKAINILLKDVYHFNKG